MRNAWFKPRFNLMLVLMPTIFIVIGLVMTFAVHEVLIYTLVGLTIIVVEFLAIGLIMRQRMRDTWESERRLYTNNIVDATNALLEALRKAGYSPVRREQRSFRSWMTYDVGKGLNVTLIPTDRGVAGCVGPVHNENRRDVEALKQLIDTALEPSK